MLNTISINEDRAIEHLMDLLAVPGLSGREGKVAALLKKKLKAAGCKPSWIKVDDANKKIPGDFEMGNLIVRIPGKVKGPTRLFMGHMDTVPLCRGAVPVRRGNRIVPKGKTALGADNRSACACLVTMVEELLASGKPHPPLTILFTVGEEIGLWGARFVKNADLGHPEIGFNIDSGDPAELIIGAIGADRWKAEIHGIASHAGVHPEHGVSALLIASLAIAEVKKKGYFGKISINGKRGTSNVGSIHGGEATNQVTDHVVIHGESRSHDRSFVDTITEVYRKAFVRAAKSVKNHKKQTGKVKFTADSDYQAFQMERTGPEVRFARNVINRLGLKPRLVSVDGGLDANYLNRKGIPTITFGAGQHNPHTLNEYVDVKEYLTGCRVMLALAVEEGF